jgi:hypothetical protein
MSGLARRLPFRIIAGRHARVPSTEDLRRPCLTALIALVVQFSLGMILNLYVTVPASDAHASYVQEVAAGPFALTVHALLGVFLICAAFVLLVRAIGISDPAIAALAATGLGAILGAFAAGEIFVRNGQNSASLWMAILTGVALASYIAALNLIRVVSAQPAPTPLAAPGHTQSSSQRDLRPWPTRPAVLRQRPLSAPHPVLPQRPPFDDPPRADAWDTAPW